MSADEPSAATGTGARGSGLAVRDVVKSYSGVEVLHGVSLDVAPGDVVGLVGHNGAGKSTLLRIIAGATRADRGSLTVDGRPAAIGSPRDALAAGIATVYQELSLLPNLTVTQNVFLGDEVTRTGMLRRGAMRDQAAALVEEFGLKVDPDRQLGEYPVATRQLLEIAVAVHRDARYVLLDEPTTSLEGRQVDEFLDTVRELAADKSLGVVLVDHKLDELYRVANRMVALVDGQVRIDAPLDQLSRDEIVVAIAGEEALPVLGSAAVEGSSGGPGAPGGSGGSAPVAALHAVPDEEPAHPAVVAGGTRPGRRLEVRGLRGPVVAGVDLVAEPGRVLGIYGLVGAGRTEVLRTLVGLDRMHGGQVLLDGRPYTPRNPAHAQREGLVYLTEERKSDGIVPRLDCGTNVVLPVLGQHRRLGLLDRRALAARSEELMERLRVRGDRRGAVVNLSGGNQQKVLLARALAQNPRVLLLDEPTKGVDLGVKAEIHRLIRSLAHDAGMTVVVVSSEEDEVCEVADDMVVLSQGTSDGRLLPPEERTPAALRRAAWAAA
ncbi:sugar ABC transporter ATP-binding protein [Cellulomonas endophytica]|uniref:sugar ABC transporter ATP-binding protein n=1 Tax=Cellulomonas endophytica TaxID=2494735 RepID=UPI0013E9747B|nr:sugar ABC transporter ATP-binding protein [Cellulomonas endophytica]